MDIVVKDVNRERVYPGDAILYNGSQYTIKQLHKDTPPPYKENEEVWVSFENDRGEIFFANEDEIVLVKN